MIQCTKRFQNKYKMPNILLLVKMFKNVINNFPTGWSIKIKKCPSSKISQVEGGGPESWEHFPSYTL